MVDGYASSRLRNNAGPKAVERWVNVAGGTPVDVFVEEIPYCETRNYVKRVLGNLALYGTLYGDNLPNVGDSLPTDYRDNIDF